MGLVLLRLFIEIYEEMKNLKSRYALNYLEKAFAERGSFMIYLKVEPYLDPLRSHPKFERMIKEMNLS